MNISNQKLSNKVQTNKYKKKLLIGVALRQSIVVIIGQSNTFTQSIVARL